MKTTKRLSAFLLVAVLCFSLTIGASAEKVIPEPDNPIWTSFGATAGGVALVEETPDGEATGDILYVTEGETFDVIANFSAPTSSIGFNLAFHYNPSEEVGVIDYLDGEWLQQGVIPYNITVAQRPPVGGDVYYIANVTFAGFNFYAVQGDVFKLTIKAVSPTPANATDYLYLSIEPKFCLSMDSTSDELLLPYRDFGVRIVVLCKEHDLEVDTRNSETHTMRCKNCPYKTSAESHNWDNGAFTPGTDCQNPDKTVYTCTTCGYSKTNYGTAEHTYNTTEKLNTTHHAKKCACGEYITEKHNWDDGKVTTKPSCAKPGEKTFTCAGCGETRTEPVPVIDHVYGNWEKLNETQHQKKCACGDTVKENHKWDNGKITTKPSCAKPGEKTFTCAGCGETKTEPVPVTDHTYTNACDPDCNGCGLEREITHQYGKNWLSNKENHYHKCTVCGNIADEDAHTPSDWIIDQEAAPAVAGSKHIECTVCKRTLQTQQIPALECKHEGGTAIAGKCDPTCEEDGNTGNTVCAICQTILQPGDPIPALGHDYQLTGQKDATCTEDGHTGNEVCQNCQDVLSQGQVIPATGHDYEDGICITCGEAEPVKPTQPTTPTTNKPTSATTPATTAPAAAENAQQSGDSGSVIIIVIVAAAVLALAGIGIFLIKRKNRV